MIVLSIIIPTYNRPQMLRRALQSIQTNKKENIEVVVCDDKSENDNNEQNKEIIDEFSQRTGIQIKYFENTRTKGVSGARNCAIEESVGEWLLFLDDDDEFVEDYIDSVFSYISLKPNIDFFWSDILLKTNHTSDRLIKKRFILNSEKELKNRVITIGISFGVCLRKSSFWECGGFKENLIVGEDTDLILNLINHNYRITHFNTFGVIKDESEGCMLSKDFEKYAKTHIVSYLLTTYFDFFSKDISLYCAFIKRGNYIYLEQKKYITNFFFTFKYILKHNQKVKVLKELV